MDYYYNNTPWGQNRMTPPTDPAYGYAQSAYPTQYYETSVYPEPRFTPLELPYMPPQYMPPAAPYCTESEYTVPSERRDNGVRNLIAGTLGIGSTAAGVIGLVTKSISPLGCGALMLCGSVAGSLLLDRESSIELKTNNGYGLRLDRSF